MSDETRTDLEKLLDAKHIEEQQNKRIMPQIDEALNHMDDDNQVMAPGNVPIGVSNLSPVEQKMLMHNAVSGETFGA